MTEKLNDVLNELINQRDGVCKTTNLDTSYDTKRTKIRCRQELFDIER